MSGGLLTRAAGRVLSPAGSRGRLAVFCYHQVLEASDSIRTGEPTQDQFAADVERIRGAFTVLTFGEAVRRLKDGTLPSMAACLTFDDGYANNHALAAPVLEQAGIPATVFVAGGAVDVGVMWNDLVIESVAAAGAWPRLPEPGDILEPEEPGLSLARIADHLLMQLKYRPVQERWDIARAIYAENVGGDLPRLMMRRTEVRDLADRGFEIGGHTISHPILKE
ncbi:MAG: polysaccharide deacetylase family protein, partial [Pseudomonadota bacterium]